MGGGPGVHIWRLSIHLTLQVHPTCSGLLTNNSSKKYNQIKNLMERCKRYISLIILRSVLKCIECALAVYLKSFKLHL